MYYLVKKVDDEYDLIGIIEETNSNEEFIRGTLIDVIKRRGVDFSETMFTKGTDIEWYWWRVVDKGDDLEYLRELATMEML